MVRIDSWESSSQYPNGHTVRVLGRAGELETEIQTILIENCIYVSSFSEAQVRTGISALQAKNAPHVFPFSVLSSERCPSTLLRGPGGWTAPRWRRGGTSGRAAWCSASIRAAVRMWTTRCQCTGWTGGQRWSWGSTSLTSHILSQRGRSQTQKHAFG